MPCCECKVAFGNVVKYTTIFRAGTLEEGLQILDTNEDIIPPNGYVKISSCLSGISPCFVVPDSSLNKTPDNIEGTVYGVLQTKEFYTWMKKQFKDISLEHLK
jgi:hypothetical protein|tara:strand:- start:243 stop:551 length:309 start_codon:yes stop_codon:yes gene_type:complete